METARNDAAVLDKYVGLFQNQNFNEYLLSNSVVDWFGRSVRGAHHIAEFFKYEVIVQYEHTSMFQKPEECEPIEQRPVHMSTKRLPPRDVDYINPRNKVNVASLKPYADSDVEDDEALHDELVTLVAGNKTPERSEGKGTIAPLTPPSSKTRSYYEASSTESDDDNDGDFMAVRAKRLKRSHPTAATSKNYLRRLAPVTRKAMPSHGDDAEDEVSGDCSGFPDATAKGEFTPLRYFEVVGVLRKRVGSAEDGRDLKSLAGTTDSADDDGDATSTGCWDRQVRIRISYRTRVADHHEFFALIIYDHVDSTLQQQSNKPLRRNLQTEFSRTVDEIGSDAETETADIVTDVPAAVTEVLLPALDLVAPSTDTGDTLMANDPMRTPTKLMHTPPATPKRKPRAHFAAMSGMKRLHVSPSQTTPKRSAARSLRL